MKSYQFYTDLLDLKKPVLIAGAAGSGKSVIVNALIYHALLRDPATTELYLVDLKHGTELGLYRSVKHCRGYAGTVAGAAAMMNDIGGLIEKRYTDMARRHIRTWDGAYSYFFIDELADLILSDKRTIKHLQHIIQIGRAAGIVCIWSTQCILASVLPSQIRLNFAVTIGLRVRSASDSRVIVGCAGLEKLPLYGSGIVAYPAELKPVYNIPMISDDDIMQLVALRTPKRKKLFGIF